MKTKLVIFDLDGTLINTIADIGNACNYALEMCGFPLRDISEYNSLVGRGIYNLFIGAMPSNEANDENARKMQEHFIRYYDEHKCDFTVPYPGIIELLKYLSDNKIKLAVASNKYQDGTEKLVKHFFGQFDFVKILGQREGQPIKPDPEIVFEAMKAGNVTDKSEVVYIGDSNVDMETGLNAGVRTVGVTWGFRTVEELSAYDVDKIVFSTREIIDYLESI